MAGTVGAWSCRRADSQRLSAYGASSPIDIKSEHTIFSVLPALQFDYDTDADLEVVNTGSPEEEATVRANVPSGAGLLTLNSTEYQLLQFHFHTESEHLVNGHQAAIELHLVHQATDGSDTLLVVGRFIEAGEFNVDLAPIFSDLPEDEDDDVEITDFDLNALLPSTLTSYRYDGSLTTSPFTEGVLWNVLSEPLQLSQDQIDAFRTLFPDGNTREVQDLNGRTILTDVPGFSTVPEPTTLALFGVGSLGLLFIRRRARQQSKSC